MTKVHPQLTSSSSSTSSKQEVFTLWMKSLVVRGNGCTVFDSSGEIVYRVDNYGHKCSHEVHLMDLTGNVLFTILKKKFKVLRCWEGYRSSTGAVVNGENNPGFQVREPFGILRRRSPCEVVVGSDSDKTQQNRYKMESRTSNSSWKIVDNSGELVAEVKRKMSRDGIVLGDDVWTMVVEPNIDQSLVMGLIIVNSLINNKM
ncbi:hypothetical protein U1Q18_026777 [Sarracenia purpurea var. burkii]